MEASALAEPADNCLCRRCHERRRITCIVAAADRVDPHPDHLVPECPTHPEPAIGDEATCRNCRRPIVYAVVEEYGHLPRTGWSDGFPRDALICFRAIDHRHIPTHA